MMWCEVSDINYCSCNYRTLAKLQTLNLVNYNVKCTLSVDIMVDIN